MEKRIDSASRVIKAAPHTIYQAFVDPKALETWLPPEGMDGHIHEFTPQEGGAYRMSLTYLNKNHPTPGKSSKHEDIIKGQFLEIVPNQRIVQLVEFNSEDPEFAGKMKMIWDFAVIPEGTVVTIVCVDVPKGISPEDHDAGLKSSLENLAQFVEEKGE